MSREADAGILDQRAVSLGRGRWLHVLAEQRGASITVVLRPMMSLPANSAGIDDARLAPATPLGGVLAGAELELPPLALLELSRALGAIAAKLGIRT